jgi:ABC-type multidrug transport system ATPase subunit
MLKTPHSQTLLKQLASRLKVSPSNKVERLNDATIRNRVVAVVDGNEAGKFIEKVFKENGIKCSFTGVTEIHSREELEFLIDSPYVLSEGMIVYQDIKESRAQFFFEVDIMNARELMERAELQLDAYELEEDDRVSSVDINDFAISVDKDRKELTKFIGKQVPAWNQFVQSFDNAVAKLEKVAYKHIQKTR